MWLLFSSALAVHLGYWLALGVGFRRARRASPPSARPAQPEPPPITALVAARNEAANVARLAAALDAQTHPQAAFVVVDDASDDGTAGRLAAWADGARRHLVRIADPRPPRKKRALTQAVAFATDRIGHDLLAFTDADCTPPPRWLETLARHHARAAGDTVLVGYGPYHVYPGWLNRLVRYETVTTAFLTAGALGLGRPYMAVGRNLSYPRRTFERVGGFRSAWASASGDDDLFVQEVARRGAARFRYVFDPEAFVPSAPPRRWRDWLRQKQRHTSAGRYYRWAVQAHLALFHASGLALWFAPLALGWAGGGLLAAKLAAEWGLVGHAARVFGEGGLRRFVPLLSFGYALYHVAVAPLGLLLRPARWGRADTPRPAPAA